MANRLLEFIFRTRKEGDDLNKTTAQLGEFKKGISGAVQELTGFNLSSIGVAAVITGVAVAMKKAVDETVAYAEQVRDLSRISGAGAEETSRLIQTADDLKVEYSTLTQAAKELAQDGIALTTEELAKSSDEYLSLTSAAERSEYAVKKFGRAGLELTKILEVGGDELRKMAKEQQGGLILTDKQVKAARDFEKAQDSLDDSVKALTISLGNGLLPVLVEVLNAFNSLITSGQRTRDEIANITNNNVELGGSYAEVKTRMIEQLEAAGYLVGKYDEIRTKGGQIVEGARIMTEAEYNVAAAFAENNRQLELAPPRFDDYTTAAKDSIQPTKDATGALWAMNGAMGDINQQMLFKRLAEGLSDKSQLSLARAMGIISEDKFAFLSSINDIKAGIKDTETSAADAGRMVFDLYLKLMKYDGLDVSAHIKTFHEIETSYKGLPAPTLSPLNAGEDAGGASGLSMTVPPGYPSDSFKIGATSGERVTITQTPNNVYNANFSGAVNINNGMDIATLAQQIQTYWQRQGRY